MQLAAGSDLLENYDFVGTFKSIVADVAKDGKWDDEKIITRTENMIRQVAGRNSDKPIFVISPFYHCGDDFVENDGAARWRAHIERIISELNYPNVTYINGLDVIGDMSYMSADEVHPNIYGVQKIADVLTEKIKSAIKI